MFLSPPVRSLLKASPLVESPFTHSFPVALSKEPAHTAHPRPKTPQAERRVNFLLKQYFANDPSCRPLVLEIAQHDPTPKKKYLAWLVKYWTEGHRYRAKSRIRENLILHSLASERKWSLTLGDEFESDIFCYTPQSFRSMMAKHRKAIRHLIRLDAIDKDLPVTCPGAEIAHQDELYTVIRIRTRSALGLLSRYGSWCTQRYAENIKVLRDEDGEMYYFPFDVILAIDGKRYLRNFFTLRDHWNRSPPRREAEQIRELCSTVKDTLDKLEEEVSKCAQDGARMTPEKEEVLIRFPDLAVEYAAKVVRERWPEFEQRANLAKIGAGSIYRYCVNIAHSRWERAERKLLRSKAWAERYAQFFDLPWILPQKKEKACLASISPKELVELRNANVSETRSRELEQFMSQRPRELSFYLKDFVRAFESGHHERLLDRAKSYVSLDRQLEKWEFLVAEVFIKRLTRRARAIESEVAKVPELALLYTTRLIGRRCSLFEAGMLSSPEFAKRYADEVVKDRWFQAEPVIRQNALLWSRYAREHNLRY